jgi:hypothetical protein
VIRAAANQTQIPDGSALLARTNLQGEWCGALRIVQETPTPGEGAVALGPREAEVQSQHADPPVRMKANLATEALEHSGEKSTAPRVASAESKGSVRSAGESGIAGGNALRCGGVAPMRRLDLGDGGQGPLSANLSRKPRSSRSKSAGWIRANIPKCRRIHVKYGGPNDPREPASQVKCERLKLFTGCAESSSPHAFVHRRS